MAFDRGGSPHDRHRDTGVARQPPALSPPIPPLTVTHVLEHLFLPAVHVLRVRPGGAGAAGAAAVGSEGSPERTRSGGGSIRIICARSSGWSSASSTCRCPRSGWASAARWTRSSRSPTARWLPSTTSSPRIGAASITTRRCNRCSTASLIRETFQCPVHRGFLCYVRSKHKVVPIEFSDADFAEAEAVLREILQVIQTGCFPRATSWKARCRDCCYRNICIK